MTVARDLLPADCHPHVRALYDYWDAKRAGRSMPGRADLDPVDMPRLLPYLFLVDVGPDGELTYRLSGSAIVAMFERDLTGHPVGTGIRSAGEEADVLARYRRIVATGEPFFHRAVLQEEKNDFTAVERMILPLAADGTTVDMLIGILVRIENPGGNRGPEP